MRILIAAGVVAAIAMLLEAIRTGYALGYFLAGLAFVLLVLNRKYLTFVWRKGPRVRITDDTVEDLRRSFWVYLSAFPATALPKALPLDAIENVTTRHYSDAHAGIVNQVRFRWGSDGRPKSNYAIKLNGMAIAAEECASLLKYRIAKAKGENPPPPAFF